jgi:ubiquinone/menaquinone biosynthesis C-methylase UbiE
MENNPFDHLADDYDQVFSMSLTGSEQRKVVWNFLEKRVFPGMEILEVNCGTGEDAFYLAGLECRVTATDSSVNMIRKCVEKNQADTSGKKPTFLQASINEIDLYFQGRKFDLIFSNFSGLNCIDTNSIVKASDDFNHLLKPEGKLIFVLFGTKCFWEKLYFMLKGNWKAINRRRAKSPVFVQIEKTSIPVYYYSPRSIKNYFNGSFKATVSKPVGIFIPPTYLNQFVSNHKFLFRLFLIADRMVRDFSVLSDRADHYIIEFRKK